MHTRIQDVIVPEVFAPYVLKEINERSALVQSGIATQNDELDQLVVQGGRTINMPMWVGIGGDSEVLSDADPLSVNKIATKKDIAALHMRGKAWGASQLSGALAGDSPMERVAGQIATYWVREEQRVLIASLRGAFASTTMAEHVMDEPAAPIDHNLVLDAKQLLGDASGQLAAIAMHSAVFTELQKQEKIEYLKPSDAVPIPYYLGYAVIVDDGMPTSTTGGAEPATTFETILFARGVIGRGSGIPVDFEPPIELDRDSLGGINYLISRTAFVLHPYGVRWNGSPAGATPTNAELATGANWERVYDRKDLGLVMLRHTI